tara:strand:+ start:347 stop:694 length:348 start_codon:yes stop_codon:yes gene_type:complete
MDSENEDEDKILDPIAELDNADEGALDSPLEPDADSDRLDKAERLGADSLELKDSLTEALTDSLLNEEAETLDLELGLELESDEQQGQPVLFLPTFLSPHIHIQGRSYVWQTQTH